LERITRTGPSNQPLARSQDAHFEVYMHQHDTVAVADDIVVAALLQHACAPRLLQVLAVCPGLAVGTCGQRPHRDGDNSWFYRDNTPASHFRQEKCVDAVLP
jgi:hypothetical protein